MTRPLPKLMDERMISEEFGLRPSTARRMMRQCELVYFEGVRKTFVYRSEVLDKLRTVPRPDRRA